MKYITTICLIILTIFILKEYLFSPVILIITLSSLAILAIQFIITYARSKKELPSKRQNTKNNWENKSYNQKQWSEEPELDEDAMDLSIKNNPEQYYRLKEYCMSKNEAKFFYYIKSALDSPEFLDCDYRVFPQVSLHSFITLNEDNPHLMHNESLYSKTLRNFTSKNVDFFICQRVQRTTKNKFIQYGYRPAMCIELDGPSHDRPVYHKAQPKKRAEDNFRRQQSNDAVKDHLFAALNIKFLRYKQDGDYVTQHDRAPLEEALRKNLLSGTSSTFLKKNS